MNFSAVISYDGSKFNGFQRLNEENSVQKTLEDALTIINKSSVVVKGAGRTDRGVHANGQCVSFKLNVNISEIGLKNALNSLVEPYIYVKKVAKVDEKFHARFSAIWKKYYYLINLGDFDAIHNDYLLNMKYKLDIEKMESVAKLFIGVHDFHNFVSGYRRDYTCIVYNIDFEIKDNILKINFKGKSFYRYMVRNMVGAMIEVGRGKIDIDVVKEALDTKNDVTIYTAPASGLYLDEIDYGGYNE